MDTPQLENGYIKIANEIMEIFAKTNIPSSERQVIDSIIRKTYGFHKKEDAISISQIITMTGLSRRMVIYALQNLEAKNMITIKREKSEGMLNSTNKISFQKNYSKWVVQRKSKQYSNLLNNMKIKYKEGSAKNQIEVVQRIEGSAKNDDLVVQRTENNSEFFAPTKDTLTKDNTKDKLPSVPAKKKPEPEEVDLRLADLLLEQLTINKPDRKQYPNEVINWADSVRLMRKQDNRTPQRIEAVIRWCQKDSFEMGVVLSMTKLRDRFDNLEMKMQKHKGNGNGGQPQEPRPGYAWRTDNQTKPELDKHE
jgi:phage replication O-like protein O